jgi:hypothetical protein
MQDDRAVGRGSTQVAGVGGTKVATSFGRNWSLMSYTRNPASSGSALCVPPPNGGAQTLWTRSFGLALSLTSTTARQASRHLQQAMSS